ncbi:MAG: hypothetical protein Q8M07_23545, partial [Prosthecobacter sp.]|nr:hypothetical protein [Prosthecobacter sp.]
LWDFYYWADELNEFEDRFLKDMTAFKGDQLSTRQAEVLLEIRDEHERLTKMRDGLSVALVIKEAYLARDDLSEDDAEFLERINGKKSLTRRDIGRLAGCAEQLNLHGERF